MPAVPIPEDEPIVDLWPDAGEALQLSRATTYAMAKAGTFPVEIVRHGSRLKVRTADLRRYLGLALDTPA